MAEPAISPQSMKLALFLLIITTILWGTTFIVTKILTQSIPIFLYQGIRHAIAFAGFIPLFPRLRYINKRVLFVAILTGGSNFIMLTTQTIGLQTTSAGKAAFITAMYVVITPFLARLILKTRIKSINWISVSLAVIGLAVLILLNPDTMSSMGTISTGDILILICAVFSALQIVFTDKYVKSVDVLLLSMLQIVIIATCSLICAGITQESWNFSFITPDMWGAWIYMGICATTFPFFFQNWGQQYVESTRAAIIFTLEPVFATLFGVLIGNEPISWQFIFRRRIDHGGDFTFHVIYPKILQNYYRTRKNRRKKFLIFYREQ